MPIKTFKQLLEIDNLVGRMYQKRPELKDTKFGYAYKRFIVKCYVPLFKDYKVELEDIRIKHAMEDEVTKQVLIDTNNTRGYKYTKDGLRAVIKEENEIMSRWDVKEVECEPFFSEYVPEDLSEEEKDLLNGIII